MSRLDTVAGLARTPRDSWVPNPNAPRWRLPRGSMLVAALFLLLVLGVTVVVPLLPGYDPYSQDLRNALLRPFSTADGQVSVLGTDSLGRDILSRLALAGRTSILISVIAVAISLVIGVVLGLIAGFYRGRIENAIMALADVQLAIPRVLLLIAVVAVVGPSIPNLVLMLGITGWISYARVSRAMALSLREREFVLAATTQGASSYWNIRRHLLPNVVSHMVIIGSFDLGQIIVLEASLSYLGLGVQPPRPSWGLMISEGQTYLQSDPWLSVLPGIAIFMLISGIQILSQRFTAESLDDTAIAAAGTA